MKKCVYALMFLFLIFCVTDYNSRIEQQYTFADDTAKREYLEKTIINETGSSESVSLAISELLLIPDDIWKDFFKNGGQLIITDDLPEEDAVGTFSMKAIGSYTIYISPDYVEYALLHEIGHYLGYVKNIENDGRFEKCLSERDKALNGVLNNNTYFAKDSEYFAEMTKLYFQGELDPDEFPLFTSYIEMLLVDYF